MRLGEADKELLESTERTVPFGQAERPTGGYTGLPEIWNAVGDGDEARAGAGLGGEGIRARGRAAAEGAEGF
ncbi:hypothetical protein [Arthrobacter sp. MW3 TE3886]|uniref:hypothetical protein n=1 Tax=Arthrobacter sp. MW3 TE3886 TaxID=3156254 RepID=UPI0035148F4E